MKDLMTDLERQILETAQRLGHVRRSDISIVASRPIESALLKLHRDGLLRRVKRGTYSLEPLGWAALTLRFLARVKRGMAPGRF